MKISKSFFLFFFITLVIHSQNNITNTLGTGGVFYIKEASSAFFILSQDNGLFIQNNSYINKPQLTLAETENDFARLNFLNNQTSDYWSIAGYLNSTAVNSRLNFYSSQLGADAMSITGSGNVGIGQPNPQYKLHVEGTVNAAEFRVNGTPVSSSQWTGSNNNIGYATGNVGVGTTTPSSKFEVVDNANAANMKITGSGTWGSQLELNPTETGSKRWMLSSVGTAGASRQGNLEFTNSSDGTTALALNPGGAVTIYGALKPNGDAGTTGKVLQSSGTNSAPTWVSPSSVQYNNIIQVSTSEQNIFLSSSSQPIPGMLYTLNIVSYSKILVEVNAVATPQTTGLSIRGDFTQTIAPAANVNSPIFTKSFSVEGTYFDQSSVQFLFELDAGSYVFNTTFAISPIVTNAVYVTDCNMIIQVIPQ